MTDDGNDGNDGNDGGTGENVSMKRDFFWLKKEGKESLAVGLIPVVLLQLTDKIEPVQREGDGGGAIGVFLPLSGTPSVPPSISPSLLPSLPPPPCR